MEGGEEGGGEKEGGERRRRRRRRKEKKEKEKEKEKKKKKKCTARPCVESAAFPRRSWFCADIYFSGIAASAVAPPAAAAA